ncbi:MAG: DUF1501 domain-containing protein [Acidimicrobiales bacterium]
MTDLAFPVERDNPDAAMIVRRRRFLQGIAAVGGAAMVPVWAKGIAEAAVPLGSNDGVIVHIMMEGGNDPLNTLVPVTNSAYYAKRGGLGLNAAATLPVTPERSLHPALTRTKALYDRGQVAFIEGVGIENGSLSHFDSAARVESAQPGAAYGKTGWLGRYVDQLPVADLFSSVSIGSTVPLVATGAVRSATAIPLNMPGAVRQRDVEANYRREFTTMRSLASGSFGRGDLADQVGQTVGRSLDVAGLVESLYSEDGDSDSLAAQLTMVARLINADLGIRVFTVTFGDFDTHASQLTRHHEALAEFDAGIGAFYSVLSSRFAGRTLLFAMSEFGRRVPANGSGGTDHGTAGLAIAIGQRVRGGIYGALPSLTDLDWARQHETDNGLSPCLRHDPSRRG